MLFELSGMSFVAVSQTSVRFSQKLDGWICECSALLRDAPVAGIDDMIRVACA
jgi:hypothetical protein